MDCDGTLLHPRFCPLWSSQRTGPSDPSGRSERAAAPLFPLSSFQIQSVRKGTARQSFVLSRSGVTGRISQLKLPTENQVPTELELFANGQLVKMNKLLILFGARGKFGVLHTVTKHGKLLLSSFCGTSERVRVSSLLKTTGISLKDGCCFRVKRGVKC